MKQSNSSYPRTTGFKDSGFFIFFILKEPDPLPLSFLADTFAWIHLGMILLNSHVEYLFQVGNVTVNCSEVITVNAPTALTTLGQEFSLP